MSDEFYTPASDKSSGVQMDAFIPLAILSIGFIVLLIWQAYNANAQRAAFESAITRQEATVTQAQHLQDSVSKLASDLMAAAQTDDTAKAIVAKYHIQQQGAPAADDAAAAAPISSPSPSP